MHVLSNVRRGWFDVLRRSCGVLICFGSCVVSFVQRRIVVVSLGVLIQAVILFCVV